MKKKLVFATNNQHKLQEIISMINNNFSVVSLADINCHADIPETSDTLEGNALQKAYYIKKNFGYDCFADDTGLEVEALGNAPGVHSARYAGIEHDSEANIQKLLSEMKDKINRKAQFRTVIALIIKENVYFFEGIIKGSITEEKKGLSGFGYDSVFLPEGYDQTFAELGADIKNNISHRSTAIKKLILFLSNISE